MSEARKHNKEEKRQALAKFRRRLERMGFWDVLKYQEAIDAVAEAKGEEWRKEILSHLTPGGTVILDLGKGDKIKARLVRYLRGKRRAQFLVVSEDLNSGIDPEGFFTEIVNVRKVLTTGGGSVKDKERVRSGVRGVKNMVGSRSGRQKAKNSPDEAKSTDPAPDTVSKENVSPEATGDVQRQEQKATASPVGSRRRRRRPWCPRRRRRRGCAGSEATTGGW